MAGTDGGSNGDYLSRFERVEKTLDSIAQRQDVMQEQLDILTRDVIVMHGTMKGSKGNNDNLVLAIRDLIDCTPADRLRP